MRKDWTDKFMNHTPTKKELDRLVYKVEKKEKKFLKEKDKLEHRHNLLVTVFIISIFFAIVLGLSSSFHPVGGYAVISMVMAVIAIWALLKNAEKMETSEANRCDYFKHYAKGVCWVRDLTLDEFMEDLGKWDLAFIQEIVTPYICEVKNEGRALNILDRKIVYKRLLIARNEQNRLEKEVGIEKMKNASDEEIAKSVLAMQSKSNKE